MIVKGIVNKNYGRENYTLKEAIEWFDIHPCETIEEAVNKINEEYKTDVFIIGDIMR